MARLLRWIVVLFAWTVVRAQQESVLVRVRNGFAGDEFQDVVERGGRPLVCVGGQWERTLDGVVEVWWPGLANTICVVEASSEVGGVYEVLGEVEPGGSPRGHYRVVVDREAKFLRIRFLPKLP